MCFATSSIQERKRSLSSYIHTSIYIQWMDGWERKEMERWTRGIAGAGAVPPWSVFKEMFGVVFFFSSSSSYLSSSSLLQGILFVSRNVLCWYKSFHYFYPFSFAFREIFKERKQKKHPFLLNRFIGKKDRPYPLLIFVLFVLILFKFLFVLLL